MISISVSVLVSYIFRSAIAVPSFVLHSRSEGIAEAEKSTKKETDLSPKQFPTKSYASSIFSPIAGNGLTTASQRSHNGGRV